MRLDSRLHGVKKDKRSLRLGKITDDRMYVDRALREQHNHKIDKEFKIIAFRCRNFYHWVYY